MNVEYSTSGTKTGTRNLFRRKLAPTPSGHSNRCSIVEGKFLIEGNCLPLAGLEIGRQTCPHFQGVSETAT